MLILQLDMMIKNNFCEKETTGALLIRNFWGVEWGMDDKTWMTK